MSSSRAKLIRGPSWDHHRSWSTKRTSHSEVRRAIPEPEIKAHDDVYSRDALEFLALLEGSEQLLSDNRKQIGGLDSWPYYGQTGNDLQECRSRRAIVRNQAVVIWLAILTLCFHLSETRYLPQFHLKLISGAYGLISVCSRSAFHNPLRAFTLHTLRRSS